MTFTKSRLDTTLYLSAVLAIVIAFGAVRWSVIAHRLPAQYAPGERFEDIPDLSVTKAPSTLILWVDSHCGPCTASMPFYQRLTAQAHRAQIVVMGREPAARLTDYLAAYGVRPAQVISVGDLALKFRITPAVVWIGADSIVRSVWYGRRQNEMEEAEIVNRVQ